MKRLTLVAAVLLLSAWPGLAEGLRDRSRGTGRDGILSELDRARLHLGPFYALSQVEFSPIYDLTYDFDLIDREETSGKREFGAGIGIPLKLFFVPSKKFVMTSEVRPMYRWFLRDEEARDFGYSYRADAHFLFNHLYVDVFGEIQDQRTRDRTELNHLADRQSGSYGAQAELTLSRTTFSLSGARRDIEYPLTDKQVNPFLTVLTRNETSVAGTVRHKTWGSTSTYIGGETTDFAFDATSRDSRRKELYIGAIRDRAIHDVQLELGWANHDYHRATENQNFSGAVGSVKWVTTPRNNLQVMTTVQRDLEFSTFGANNHYVNDRLQLITTIPLGRLFRIDLQGQAARDSYPIAEPMKDGTFAKRRDVLLLASAGASVNIGRHLGIGLGLGYYDRSSNFDEFDEDGIQPLILLSVRP